MGIRHHTERPTAPIMDRHTRQLLIRGEEAGMVQHNIKVITGMSEAISVQSWLANLC